MIPLLYLRYYLLVKAVGKVVPAFGTRLSRRVHRRAADEVARDVELESITPTGDGRLSFECVLPDEWLADGRTVRVDGSVGLRTAKVVRRSRIALGGATYAFSGRSVAIGGREPGGRAE